VIVKYIINLKSDFPLENDFDEVVDSMDDGSMTSKHAANKGMDGRGQEGHLAIEGDRLYLYYTT